MSDKFISIPISDSGYATTVKQAKFVVRESNGDTLAEGLAMIESCNGNTTVSMTREMALELMTALSTGRPLFPKRTESTPEFIKEVVQNEQALNDGNYCDPNKQTGSVYGRIGGVGDNGD